MEYATYDVSFYKGSQLNMWAKRFAKYLPPNISFIVSAGTSGAAIASAILMLKPKLTHVNVHPNNYRSHRNLGKSMSGIKTVKGNGVIVDDFIHTGKTIERAIHKFKRRKKGNGKIISVITSGSFGYHKEQHISNKLGLPVIFANGRKTITPMGG